ncbi:hypothetical protein ACF3NA_01905 [Alkanindiges sp. WGS2144]|uniref:hypothetical protein n=1 Tax=Alkanindiges sp. WGS2144 TaxID=3366808 RepID=UPI003750700F
MVKIIKRGGFREQAARQLKYKNSVNQRTDIQAPANYQPVSDWADTKQPEANPTNQVSHNPTDPETDDFPATK